MVSFSHSAHYFSCFFLYLVRIFFREMNLQDISDQLLNFFLNEIKISEPIVVPQIVSDIVIIITTTIIVGSNISCSNEDGSVYYLTTPLESSLKNLCKSPLHFLDF